MRRLSTLVSAARKAEPADKLEEFLAGEEGDTDLASDDQREMILNVLNLRDMRVDDVMVPRADIVAVEQGASLEELLEKFRTSSHSRLPVYRETLDDPVGVVHLKDIALTYGFGNGGEDFAINKHLRSVLVVPPSQRLQDLLQRMQATRRHMALVIDEYGGVDGVVTIEDLIEQIVGEIEDEHDVSERPMWKKRSDNLYTVSARADIVDFEAETGRSLLPEDWEEEVDTLGGLVFVLCGRVPERGEVVSHPDGHEFEILDADPRRIKRMRVRLAGESQHPVMNAIAAQ
ncbi:MAG: hemolysin family protein [Neomegalonema sp.]|nr:hemolysin family protein [Neomegalonema sp.]